MCVTEGRTDRETLLKINTLPVHFRHIFRSSYWAVLSMFLLNFLIGNLMLLITVSWTMSMGLRFWAILLYSKTPVFHLGWFVCSHSQTAYCWMSCFLCHWLSCLERPSCRSHFSIFFAHFPKTFKTAPLSTLLSWPCPLNYFFSPSWSLW